MYSKVHDAHRMPQTKPTDWSSPGKFFTMNQKAAPMIVLCVIIEFNLEFDWIDF
jgi:hypothetical protein